MCYRLVFFLLLAVLVPGHVYAHQPVYTFVSIDVPNDAGVLGFTTLGDVNDSGELVASFTDSSGPGVFLTTLLDTIALRCPGVSTTVQPHGLNSRGALVLTCQSDDQPRSYLRERRHGHPLLRLLGFAAALTIEARKVNDADEIAGAFTDAGGVGHGFVLRGQQVEVIDVPFLGATGTGVAGLNNRRDIVGGYIAGGAFRGFLRTEAGYGQLDMPEATFTGPVAINDDRLVGGVWAGSDGLLKSFLYEDGVYTPFAVPFAGAILTEIRGINNRGQIVGRYVVPQPGNDETPFASRGFVATPDRPRHHGH